MDNIRKGYVDFHLHPHNRSIITAELTVIFTVFIDSKEGPSFLILLKHIDHNFTHALSSGKRRVQTRSSQKRALEGQGQRKLSGLFSMTERDCGNRSLTFK